MSQPRPRQDTENLNARAALGSPSPVLEPWDLGEIISGLKLFVEMREPNMEFIQMPVLQSLCSQQTSILQKNKKEGLSPTTFLL